VYVPDGLRHVTGFVVAWHHDCNFFHGLVSVSLCRAGVSPDSIRTSSVWGHDSEPLRETCVNIAQSSRSSLARGGGGSLK
jgi:hypothetical protein